jgi:SAM-dependent methyltransferase
VSDTDVGARKRHREFTAAAMLTLGDNANMNELPDASPYDSIAAFYDRWSTSVVEDINFYVEEAVMSGGPVLELGVGTGRIALPIAHTGVRVIGVDSSPRMLELCREHAAAFGLDRLLDLRLGDLRDPPLETTVPLAISPFRAFLHLQSDGERLQTLSRIRELLQTGGRLVFDVFAPTDDDIAATQGRWIEREPGIQELADWDPPRRTFNLHVHAEEGETEMHLAWTSVEEWIDLLGRAGFTLGACYGWFDRQPYSGGEDMVFVADNL